MSETKRCSTCGVVKPFDCFTRNASSPDGRYSKCKSCRKLVAQAWRNKPEVNAREKERLRLEYLNNKEDKRAKRKLRYERDREGALAKNREWRELNLEKHRALCRKWAKEHPEEMRVIVARRRAMLYGAEGSYTKSDVLAMLEAQKNKCAACGKSFEEIGFHVDHVFPLSKGGKNSPDNLQLLCPSCNKSKANKLPGEWRAAA